MCVKLNVSALKSKQNLDLVTGMSFFRAQGMMAGPFIELEKPVDFGRGEE